MNLYAKIPMLKFSTLLKSQLTSPGSFLRNFAVLGSGTLLAQAIPVLVSPVLTRIYSPEDFAMLALFTALVGTFTPIVCGKYEVALVTPKKRIYAEHLLGIAVYCAFAISIFLAVVFVIGGKSILAFLNAERLGIWIFSVPAALLFTGLFTAGNYWANRNKEYRLMSTARVIRAVLAALTGILSGLAGAAFAGLLAGFFAGLLAATLFIFCQDRSLLNHRIWRWSREKKMVLSRYRSYPLYNATSGLMDGITLSLPVFFISRYFPEAVVGYYALVFRVASAPIGFISASVSQINLKKVVDIVNSGQSPVKYLLTVAALLASIVSLPAMIIIVWGPGLFAILFGKQWAQSGEYARILMPAICVQFTASTLSSTMGATNNNRLGAIWKILAFISTGTMLLLVAPQGDVWVILYALTILNMILYTFYFIMILYAAHKPRNFK